jgi:hypothetical protein
LVQGKAGPTYAAKQDLFDLCSCVIPEIFQYFKGLENQFSLSQLPNEISLAVMYGTHSV